jgi:hypothetical protein
VCDAVTVAIRGCEAILDAQDDSWIQELRNRGKMQQVRGGTSWVNFINTSAGQ